MAPDYQKADTACYPWRRKQAHHNQAGSGVDPGVEPPDVFFQAK